MGMGEAQLVRINLALARIDATTARRDVGNPAGNFGATVSAEFKARHETLRKETAAALADLDALIASQSRAVS